MHACTSILLRGSANVSPFYFLSPRATSSRYNSNVCFAIARHPNIYIKLTPRIFAECRRGNATPKTFFQRLVAEFGAQRLAWGSNYPSSEGKLPELLKMARDSVSSLPQADLDWIFAKTAQTLYPALAD